MQTTSLGDTSSREVSILKYTPLLLLAQVAAVLAAVLQLLIDLSSENIVCTLLILGASTATLQYLSVSSSFERAPISSFSLLGLCVTTQLGALFAQTFYWLPVSHNLWDAQYTFAHLAGFQLTAVLAHIVYQNLPAFDHARNKISSGILTRVGLYRIPSPATLWIMGVIGMFALFMTGHSPSAARISKILSGITFLAWSPFLIPVLRAQHGNNYCNISRQLPALLVYFLAAVVIGLALNFRSPLFVGITTVALLLLLLNLSTRGKAHALSWKAFGLLAFVAVLGIQYGGDIATAMAIARKDRGNISPLTMIDETIRTLSDRKVLEVYRESLVTRTDFDLYDETYIESEVVARFVETKFHDNVFYFGRNLSETELIELRRFTVDRTWAILPAPILSLLGVSLDKQAEQTYSFGDYIFYLRHGGSLGGYRTGSAIGHGLSLLGEWFYPIFFAVCISLFFAWDLHTVTLRNGTIVIAPVAMVFVLKIFMYGIAGESLGTLVTTLVRTIWQNIFLFLIIFIPIQRLVDHFSELMRGVRR